MGLHRFMALSAVAAVILIALLVWFMPSSEDFRTDNPFWNGTNQAVAAHNMIPLESLTGLSSLPARSALILVPYEDFSAGELGAVDNFISAGGTLVLADDYGYGNHVLEYLGLKARFSGQTLLDPLVNYHNKRFPRIGKFQPGPLTDNVTGLVFNHATGITGEDPGAVLALSSAFSYLDLNDNGSLDGGEPTGPQTVISQHSLGSGRLILVADPSLFINGMDTMESNGRFITNIAASAASVYIDQSHLPANGLVSAKRTLAGIRGSLATPPATFALVVVALAIVLRPVWRKTASNKIGDDSGYAA